MPEDHGTRDAASGAVPGSDAAVPVPATPAALSDKDLDKVAGGSGFSIGATNTTTFKAPTGPTSGPRLK